jgi:hypothetical protein
VTDDEIMDAIRARVSAGHPADIEDSGPLPEPASEAVLASAERIVGCPLPPLLRRLYGEIANGGFGPFDGIQGVEGGYSSGGPDMIASFLEWQEAADELPAQVIPPPPGVLFLCDLGCATWTLLDCRSPEGRIRWWDQGAQHELDLTLAGWFELWLADRLDMSDPGLRLR